jgi:hypothetical protein
VLVLQTSFSLEGCIRKLAIRNLIRRRMMEGANSTMVYFKNLFKCHNVPPVLQKEKAIELGKRERETCF